MNAKDSFNIGMDLLKSLHEPNPKKQEPTILENKQTEPITQNENRNFAQVLHDAASVGRYYVFQLVGRFVVKKDGEFVYDKRSTSHDYLNPVAVTVKNLGIYKSIDKLESRRSRLSDYHQQEISKWSRSSGDRNNLPQEVGNVIVVLDKLPEQKGQRLMIYGAFSTESLSDYRGGRMNPDNGFSFFLPDNEKGGEAINLFVDELDTQSKLHAEGTKKNYETFRKAISKCISCK